MHLLQNSLPAETSILNPVDKEGSYNLSHTYRKLYSVKSFQLMQNIYGLRKKDFF